MSNMLLYRCLSSSPVTFYNTLENLLNDRNITDVVLGNFKIDILKWTHIDLQYVLCNYTVLVNEATHISGSQIDHVYVNNGSLLSSKLIKLKYKVFIFLTMAQQSLDK